jgi:hypothetical protein
MTVEPFIVPSIVAGFKTCRQALKKYKKKKNISEETVSPLDAALDKEQGDIEREWNKLAEVLGSKFAQGDGMSSPIVMHNTISISDQILIVTLSI